MGSIPSGPRRSAPRGESWWAVSATVASVWFRAITFIGVLIAIDLRCVPDTTACVDGDYLQQALMNLLLNAIDASGQGGSVAVTVGKTDAALQVDIEDSGPGLTAEQQDRMFEAFYTTKANGTGLGLAVTKTLLEKMGATIKASNGSYGARFEVLLPIEHDV